jgi:hypothetical protein
MIAIAVAGLIFSVFAPGWTLALVFAVLLVYLWNLRTRRSKRKLRDAWDRSPRSDIVEHPERRANTPNIGDGGYRSLEWKGMIFRSKSEVRIAKTLDHRRIFFIPPTRVRVGKTERQNRELDFVICHKGKWGVLEVDGPYHDAKFDAQRDQVLRAHGIVNIQRFPSERCYQEPHTVIDEFLRKL